jgi:hypothetical protein
MYSQNPYEPSLDQLENDPNFSPELMDLNEIQKHQELPDGSSVFVVGKKAGDTETSPADDDFYANLAEDLDDGTLNSLSAELLSNIKDDRSSRAEWEATCNLAIKYLGFKVEEFHNIPFVRCCAAFDTTLSTTLMNFFASAKAELFPPGGPAKSMIEGYPSEQMEDRGDRVQMFMNLFLTTIDKSYYPDSDRLLMYVGLFGSAFRKVVMDPILGRPAPRFVKPQNLIINNFTTSLLESTRITEEIYLTRKEVLIRQRDGVYKEDSLPKNADDNEDMDSSVNKTIKKAEGVQESQSENKSLFKFYECHVELEPSEVKDVYGMPKKGKKIKKDNIPRPYIVEICEATKKIVSIRRNWEENDRNFKRIECYVHYYYLPGFGIYSTGLAQLQGSNAIMLTDILRQQIDAGTLRNFPGGLKKRGMREENNNKAVGPGEFLEFDTEGPIQESVMLMPYQEPSSVLAQLRTEVKTDTMALGGASQQGANVGGSNTPVGTILAQIEIQNRIPSTILKSLHSALGYELQLLKKLFAKYFSDEPYPFSVPGNHQSIMREDFSDNINIVPVSDPNVITTTQRVIVNEIVLKMAQANPTMFDLREANERMLRAMKIDGVEKLMPKPQEIMPLDPISENMAIILGKGAKAGIQQDHQAHIIVHSQAGQQLAQDPAKAALMQAHISEHQAFMYLMQMQQAMGMQMPPEQALKDPQVQNQIAMAAAQAAQQLQQQQQAQNPPPLDPNVVMLKDIEQRREASHLKHEEAQLRAETEAFKVQTQFESSKVKMDVDKEMAKDRNEVTLAIAKMKQPNNLE